MDVAIQYPGFRRPFYPGYFPNRIYDQYFGEHFPDADMMASFFNMFYNRPYYMRMPGYMYGGFSEVRSDNFRYEINLDVKHFSPEELTVRVNGEYVEVHGKHDERQDEHGFVSREFFRRYKYPAGVEPGSWNATLSYDGILTVTAPRNKADVPEHNVPITFEDKAPAQK